MVHDRSKKRSLTQYHGKLRHYQRSTHALSGAAGQNSSYRAGITMRIFALCLIGLLLSTGCSKVGEKAGRAQAKIERKVDAVERGHDEGYKGEKAKQPQK
jgi:hypothetical protein